ncbi:apolipoprotein N-acyltransferase [Candidatus Kapabacteria bacterium]|nr:apolipoprotein N-acyltransferase [Candidatus Kapabacteria bacterium]
MKIGISVLTGVLLALSFPPLPFYFLAFVAFLPLLIFIESKIEGTSNANFFLSTYLTFVIYHVASNWWISSFQEETDPFLMASGFAMDIAHPLFFLIPTYIYYKVRKKFGFNVSIFFFPVIWTGWEYFHSYGEFSYPWLALGNNQIYNTTWIQFIDITGVFGATFLIALSNSLIMKMYKNVSSSTGKFKAGINLKWSFLLLSIFIIPLIYGAKKNNEFSDDNISSEEVSFGVVQPNKYPWKKWASGNVEQVKAMMAISDSLLNEDNTIDLFLWPETSILFVNLSGFNTAENLWFVQDWVDSNNVSLISGFIHRYVYKNDEQKQTSSRQFPNSDQFYEHFNSAIMLNPNLKPQTYHKMKLTPFAERIPNLEYFSFLMDYIKWGVGISSWGIGKDQHNLLLSNNDSQINIGNIICIESIYPEFCRNFALQGAEILSIITNDSWYDGTPGPEQHWQIARIRAIENRRYIVRSANSGVCGIIAPNGQEINRLNQYKQSGIIVKAKKVKTLSFYTKHGDLLAKSLFLIGVLIWIASFIYPNKKTFAN